MGKQRHQYSGEFKAKVVLEVLKGQRTVNEIASRFGVHPVQVFQWKKQAVDELPRVFADRRGQAERAAAHEKAELFEQIGRLKMELEWLKKKSASPSDEKRGWIDWDHGRLSVRRQCTLIGLPRTTLYYTAEAENAENLRLMRWLDEQYTRTPFYGSRRLRAWLHTPGHTVNHKRIERLLRVMGIAAIHPCRQLSRPAPGHRIYPYLLRGVVIDRVDQVWSTDITYIRLRHGFAYLAAIIDWFSRYVLAWELSTTLETDFCGAALEWALRGGCPEIFNTDQGAQFTSAAFTGRLEAAAVRISMDGRGRALDNVFVERLWRSVKYEHVYLYDYEGVPELRAGLGHYFQFYNHERLHQALGYRTPAAVYGVGRCRARRP